MWQLLKIWESGGKALKVICFYDRFVLVSTEPLTWLWLCL